MTIQNDSTTITLYAGRRVIVVGLGRSGMAAAHALRDGGATVLCWDDGEAARTTAASDRFDIVNPTDSGALDGVACMILAPGIPLTHPRPHPAVKARDNDLDGDGIIDIFDPNDGTTGEFGGSFAVIGNDRAR